MSYFDGHHLTLTSTDDGQFIADCECGWQGPRAPKVAQAAEFWGMHLTSAVLEKVTASL